VACGTASPLCLVNHRILLTRMSLSAVLFAGGDQGAEVRLGGRKALQRY
jgi:hypothetical protein